MSWMGETVVVVRKDSPVSSVSCPLSCRSLQYQTMVELLESIERMAKNAPYRKFRPDVSVQTSAVLWLVHCVFP